MPKDLDFISPVCYPLAMQKLTHAQLRDAIADSKGTVFVGIIAVTDARARKTGNPHGKILKQSRFAGVVGARYGAAVDRESGGEGFEPQPLPWGEWDVVNKVKTNGGKLYLRTQSRPRQRKAVKPVVHFRDEDGIALDYAEVKPFLPKKRAVKTQAKVGLETADSQVEVRDFAFDSIKRIRMNGKTYKLVAK